MASYKKNPFDESEPENTGREMSTSGFARLDSVSLSGGVPGQYSNSAVNNNNINNNNNNNNNNINNNNVHDDSEYTHQVSASAPVEGDANAPTLVYAPTGELRFPDAKSSPYRDWPFAIAFFAQLVGIIIVAAVYGPAMLSDASSTTPAPAGSTPENSKGIIAVLVVSTLISALFSAAWLAIMRRFADRIIHISIITGIALYGLGAILSFAYGSIGGGVLYIIIIALQLWYYYSVRSRIPFAHAILSASCSTLGNSWGPFIVVYGLSAVLLLWLSLWSFAFAGVDHASNGGSNSFSLFFLLLSLFWTSMVIKNVGHVTTSGAVASEYFNPGMQYVTKGAFYRACTTSFGSICFGSLIVSFIRTLRVMCELARGNGEGTVRQIISCVVVCMLGLLERMIAYFNHYAYSLISIYGFDFITASKRTWELMQAKMFTAIINDDLTSFALTMGILLSGISAGIIGAVWSAILGFQGWLGVAIMAFVLGLVMGSLFMSVVDSAVTTTFIVWAEDPMTFAKNQSDLYWRIARAAEPLYGSDPRMTGQQA